MLQLFVEGTDLFNEKTEEFYEVKSQELLLEHSLLSLSKWEAKWKKPFLNIKPTYSEFIDYIRCMTINRVDPLIYKCLTPKHINTIRNYIDDSMTATTFSNNKKRAPRPRKTTSELIYYWMFSQNIPIECEKWHLNRLLTLIRVSSIENNPKGRKMSKQDILRQNAQLNAARRAKYHSKG